MYAKIFRALWDGTLADSWEAWALFVFLLAHADAEGFVDMTPQSIARRSSIPLEAVLRGLEVLEAPDPMSRSEAEGGRRLVRVDDHRPWGWQIVNARHYRGITDAETVREQARVRQADRRGRLRAAGGRKPGVHRDGCLWSAARPDVLYLGCPECQEIAFEEGSDRHAVSRGVTRGHAESRHAEAEGEVEADTPSSLRSEGAGALPVDPVGDSVQRTDATGPGAGPAVEPSGRTGAGATSEPGAEAPGAPAGTDLLGEFRQDVARAHGAHLDMAGRGLTIPTNRPGVEWAPTPGMLAEWKRLFPAIDVEAEIRRIRAWGLSHPTRRKTMRGMEAHVSGWLSDEQNKGGRSDPARGPARGSHRVGTDARYAEQNRGAIAAGGEADGRPGS